jgi:hypothetical protein
MLQGGPTMPFTTFRMQGLEQLDGAALFEILRGPYEDRKITLLYALHVLRALAAHWADKGPPHGDVWEPVTSPFLPLTAIVIEADVLVSPETRGHARPSVIPLGTIGVTLEVDGPVFAARYTARRLVCEDGVDRAKGPRSLEDWRDLQIAGQLVAMEADAALASARSPCRLARPPGLPKLGERHQHVLDVVAKDQFSTGTLISVADVLMSVPKGAAERRATEQATAELVQDGYLSRVNDMLSLTVRGLMACAKADEAAAVAERMLGYVNWRAEKHRGLFTQFSWPELWVANVAGDREEPMVHVVIALFDLGVGRGPWDRPHDIVDLRSIDDINGLVARAQVNSGHGNDREGGSKMSANNTPVCVFVSYAQEDEAHKKRVTDLIEDLRTCGIDAHFDRDIHGTPREGWPRWMEDQIAAAAYVLVICTETYLRRYEQRERPGKGKGAIWEGTIIRQEMYDSAGNNRKFAAVMFDSGDEAYKPQPLRPHTHYIYPQDRTALLRWLTNQPAYLPKPLGKVPVLPPDP